MSLRKMMALLALASLVLAGVGVARHQFGAAPRGAVAAPPEVARREPRDGAGEDRRNEAERARVTLENLRKRVEEEEQRTRTGRLSRELNGQSTCPLDSIEASEMGEPGRLTAVLAVAVRSASRGTSGCASSA